MLKIVNYYYEIDNIRYWYTDSVTALERLVYHAKLKGLKLDFEKISTMIKRHEREIGTF